ncbi:lactonase family protein [Silvibacterium acidisoli]|uniref:lactonase family protein n=1 Tax=Acidobacteriaceae bacterium ZG23-2 TaxID=2883246 RepID=UPI00406D1582
MLKLGRSILAVALSVGAFVPTMYGAVDAPNTATVYVMTNSAEHNEVVAYSREYDGRFSERHRYSTNGRGSGGTNDPLQSQGSLTFSSDHHLLFAVNAGSGTLTSFLVGPRGQLLLVDTVPSGGSEPLAVASWQNRVYVLNGAAAGTVVGFVADPVGRLRQVPDATAFLSATSAGGSSISIAPNGRFLVVTERLTNNFDSFAIQPDGKLGPIQTAASPVPGIFSGRFDLSGRLILSSTGPAGSTDSTISSFSLSSNGTLIPVTQSLQTFGSANCWNAITPNGKFAYVSNAGSSTISGFTIGAKGTLQPIGSTIVATQPEGSTNLDITISGDGTSLYALNSMVGTIGVFKINADGTLTPEGDIEGLPKNVGFNGIAAY